MGQWKGQSIEDILRQQMEKGGSGGKPPGGRGGGGGSDSSSGGSDGMSNETLQVVLASVSFILMVNSLSLSLYMNCVYAQVLPSPLISLKISLFTVKNEVKAWSDVAKLTMVVNILNGRWL